MPIGCAKVDAYGWALARGGRHLSSNSAVSDNPETLVLANKCCKTLCVICRCINILQDTDRCTTTSATDKCRRKTLQKTDSWMGQAPEPSHGDYMLSAGNRGCCGAKAADEINEITTVNMMKCSSGSTRGNSTCCARSVAVLITANETHAGPRSRLVCTVVQTSV